MYLSGHASIDNHIRPIFFRCCIIHVFICAFIRMIIYCLRIHVFICSYIHVFIYLLIYASDCLRIYIVAIP